MKQALEEGKGYDLILVDLNMPQLNGYETMMKITTVDIEHDWKSHIVACSAQSEESAGNIVGFDGYLEKPIKVDKLEALIQSRKLH